MARRLRGPGLALACALAALVPSRAALADVIAPPPARCPEGSRAIDFCHGPPTCEARSCTDDADCAPTEVCEQRALCTREHCCSGRACGSPDAPRYTHVEAACASGTCSDSSTTCTSIRVCVPRPAGTDAGGDLDASSGEDAGSAGDGGHELDASSEDDGGSSDEDGGGTAPEDSGAGAGAETGGGCCSVAGRRDGTAAALASALVALLLGARRRARRAARPRRHSAEKRSTYE